MKMSEKVKTVIAKSVVAYVASADEEGRPHLAVSRLIRVLDDQHVAFTAWFCPRTAENVSRNPAVSVAVWDSVADHGYQIVGRVSDSSIVAVVDGWSGDERSASAAPQEERKLTVKVEQIMEFKTGVHTDDPV